jgi:hypothetical protein
MLSNSVKCDFSMIEELVPGVKAFKDEQVDCVAAAVFEWYHGIEI